MGLDVPGVSQSVVVIVLAHKWTKAYTNWNDFDLYNSVVFEVWVFCSGTNTFELFSSSVTKIAEYVNTYIHT